MTRLRKILSEWIMSIVLVARISYLPVPHAPSVRHVCTACAAPVWLADSVAATVPDLATCSLICNVCVCNERAKPQDSQPGPSLN